MGVTKRKRKPYVPMQSLMLRALAGSGGIGVALIAPPLTRLLKEFDSGRVNRSRLYQRMDQAIGRLQAAQLVRVSGTHGRRTVELTEKGKRLAEEAEFKAYRIPEPAFWDGKWRVLAFDMTERRRKARIQLRQLLQNAGFIRLQDSVWIYPYPCDEFIGLVRAHLKSGTGEMRSFVAEAFENDRALRTHFRLT